MKKKGIAFLLAGIMAFSNVNMVFAKESTFITAEAESYSTVSPEEAVQAGTDGSAYVLDVRTYKEFAAGRVINSIWCPQFPSIDFDDSILDNLMVAYAKEHFLNDGDTKPVYIICRSGKVGAPRAAGNLLEAGVDPSRIFIVEGGASALKKLDNAFTADRTLDDIDWQYIKPEDALNALRNSDIQFIDLRSKTMFNQANLPGSLNCDLTDAENAEVQMDFYYFAEENLNKDHPVYLLCSDGNKCSKTAFAVLRDFGFDTNKIFIIENGAESEAISDLLLEFPFTDVKKDAWYYSQVKSVYRSGLMTGKDSVTFAPDEELARAQFALILYRMEGEPEVASTEPAFPDAEAGWYKNAVIWASENSIITGYSDTGLFGPADPINREQMATIMFRYAKHKGWDINQQENISTFPDASRVNPFAKDAVSWAVANKIISGNNGNLDPQGSAVRAQAATIISRFTAIYPVLNK